MAKIKCQFMNLGEPLFLMGTDYGKKLTPKHSKGTLEIFWDEDKRRAEIHSIKGFTFITEPWVFSYEPLQDKTPIRPENKHLDHAMPDIVKAQVGGPQDIFNAQVETPHSKIQGKPGKRPKYQGEETQGE